jgi:cytochrome P450
MTTERAASQTQAQQGSILDVLRSTWDTVELFEQVRQHMPVIHVAELDAWVLSRYEDIAPVVNDPERFGSMPADLVGEVPEEVRERLPHGYAPWQPALVNQDPPEHTRVRRLAQKPLTPKAIGRHEEAIRAVANRLIDAFIDHGRTDLADTYAAPLPVQVLGQILGIPRADHQQFREWTLGITELFIPSITQQRRLQLAREQVDFTEYILDVIQHRRRNPGEDLVSGLILAQEQGEKSLTDREVLGVIGQLIIAGFETSAGGISFTLYQLGENPRLRERIRNDLSLVPKLVEESLRRLTPARGIVRRVKQDCEIGGHHIKAGQNLFLLVQSANNDPAQFSCPAKIDLDRDPAEMKKSLHWGSGNHTCIGMPLARLDLKVAIETALTRLPNLRVVPDQQILVQPGMIFHRPASIDFEWDAQIARPADGVQ